MPNKETLNMLSERFGNAFYLLDSKQFETNFYELYSAFSSIYNNFNIAYSYKTDYTPKFCKIVNKLGGYAEVVSDMEAELALRIGVEPSKIIWNGPYKNYQKAKQLLLLGGTVNLDSEYEFEQIKAIAKEFPNHKLNVGVRCSFDINDGIVSRFGFDTKSETFKQALELVQNTPNIHFKGLMCHFASRSLETWQTRTKLMLALLKDLNIVPEVLDLGGGLYGKMPESLKSQFSGYIPTYEEYANTVATQVYEAFKNCVNKPKLLIEPGSALVGDCMKFAAKVINVKTSQNKSIATVLGSIYNINPTLNKKNPPIEIIPMGGVQQNYEDLDFGGFTCIESDYIYRHFSGNLAVGDFAVFGNAGSYSVVLKPPFILPNFPIIDVSQGLDNLEIIKRGEVFDDLFHTFRF